MNNGIPRWLKLFAAGAGAIVVGMSAWGILADPLTQIFDLQTRTAAAAEHGVIRESCMSKSDAILESLGRIEQKIGGNQ